MQVKEQLTSLDRTNEPLWSTFCGVTNGVWQGRMAAFYAATGTINRELIVISLLKVQLQFLSGTLLVSKLAACEVYVYEAIRLQPVQLWLV